MSRPESSQGGSSITGVDVSDEGDDPPPYDEVATAAPSDNDPLPPSFPSTVLGEYQEYLGIIPRAIGT